MLREKISTGIDGLDRILGGGLPKHRAYLVHGGYGTGKTTLALQFLREGIRRGERVLFVSLLQSHSELEDVFQSHGWTSQGIEVLNLPKELQSEAAEDQTLFNPADIDLSEATELIRRAIAEQEPQRLVVDSISELAVLVQDPFRLRRHILAMKQQIADADCTALFTINETEVEQTASLKTLMHGVIRLASETPDFGRVARRLEVSKLRGMPFNGGFHDFMIRTGGLEVFPRLTPVAADEPVADWSRITSGNEALDALLGGGLEAGTACMLTGTTGTGKTTLATAYVKAAADRGEKAAVFCFDERRSTFIHRAANLGLDLREHLDSGRLQLHEVNVGEVSAGRLTETIRRLVDEEGVKLVVIDSVSGYLNAMPGQRELMVQLHELLSHLGHRRVLTFLIVSMHGLYGTGETVDASYLADTVVMMRHFEAAGEIRRCVSVIKKRHGPHESTIREISSGPGGLVVGPPLQEFTGVLTGSPTYHGQRRELLDDRSSDTAHE
jgi:circadian clock protein KaiC